MSQRKQVDFRVLNGPSMLAPFAAVVAEFDSGFTSRIPADPIRRQLAELLPERLRRQMTLAPGDVAFEDLAASLANALQDLRGPCGLPVAVQRTDSGHCRIAMGFHDPQAALLALRAGLEIAAAAFESTDGGQDRARAIAATLGRAQAVILSRQPDFIARSLMRVARNRGIPVYPVSPGSRIWMYGQGSAGLHFLEAANHRDSLTGHVLTRDKFLSNQLLTRLGLPGVTHGIARDVHEASRIAAQLGFPVVVKPIDMGKGKGVTANIDNADELALAFAKAIEFSKRGLIVERHVPGEDHRIAVFGGQLAWVVRRTPPRIVGDGQHTVGELIERESGQRSEADIAAGFTDRLRIDADMLNVLAKQRLTPQDRPAAGRSVPLRSIANLATGGTYLDCTAHIHPDNREMAETIARAFHMDAIGIDFITTDISRSWREGECAVIEVNATPGLSADFHAEIILRHKFRHGVDGRVPSIVLIGADASLAGRIAGVVQDAGLRVGQTDNAVTVLSGRPFGPTAGALPARVMALLLDPSCDALVIGASPHDIESQGFPLDRCDLALIAQGASLPAPMRRLIGDCAAQVIEGVSAQNLESLALPAVAGWLGNRWRAPLAGLPPRPDSS